MTTIIDLNSGSVSDSSEQVPVPFMKRPKEVTEPTYLDTVRQRIANPETYTGAVEAPLTAANQLLTGMAAMPAEWLGAGKSMALDLISGKAFESGMGGWEGAKQRAFEKGQEAAADMQRVLGYEPKTPAGQQQAENVGKIFETGEKAIATVANIKGDLYKPLGLKSIEKDDPIAAHYLSQIAFLMGLKATHSTVKGTKAKYEAWRDKVEQAKTSGKLPEDFAEIEKAANTEAAKRADTDFEKARQEMEMAIAANQNFAMPRQAPSARQYAIDQAKSDAELARPSLEDTARANQEAIRAAMPDLPQPQPTTVEQPISPLTQGQEVAKILKMQKPPLTPEQRTAEAVRQAAIPQTPPDTSPMPETTLAPEGRTQFNYPKPSTPVMAPEKIRNLLPNENDLYRKVFVTPEKKAPAVKNLQQQPKPLADLTQEEISKMSPEERVMAVLEAEGGEVTPEAVAQGVRASEAMQSDLAKKAASPQISQAAPEKGVTPVEGEAAAPKVKVPETKLTNDMRALGWSDAQIKEFTLSERKQVVKDQSIPEPREQDSFASKADKELFEKYIAEKPSTNYTPETGEAALKAIVPEATRWINGDTTINLEALRERIQGIASQFDPNNLSHDRVTLPADKLLAELSRIEMERSGIKIPEVAEEIDWYGEGGKNAKETGTQAKATSEGEGPEGRKGKRVRVRNAEENRVEAQEGEVTSADTLRTPEQVDAAIKYEADTRNLRFADEAANRWAIRDPDGYNEFVARKVRRATDLDIPERSVTALDFIEAIRDILGNESGAWTIRDRKPPRKVVDINEKKGSKEGELKLEDLKPGMSVRVKPGFEDWGVEGYAFEKYEQISGIPQGKVSNINKYLNKARDYIKMAYGIEGLKTFNMEHELWKQKFGDSYLAGPRAFEEVLAKHEKGYGNLKEQYNKTGGLEFENPGAWDNSTFEKFLDLSPEEASKQVRKERLSVLPGGILGNERGGWSTQKKNPLDRLTATDIGAIDKLYKVAKVTGSDPKEILRKAGISEETIALAEKVYNDYLEPLRKQGLKPILQGPYKDRNPADVLRQDKRTYKGETITSKTVFKQPAEAFVNAPDLKRFDAHGIKNPIYVFDKLPEPLREFYYRAREALHKVDIRSESLFKEVDEAAKGLGKKALKRVMSYAIGVQDGSSPNFKRGAEILKSMGIKEVKALTPKEMDFYKFLRSKLDTLFTEINEVRKATGRNPLKELPEYFTFMRAFSFWERMAGKGDMNRKLNLAMDDKAAIDHMYKTMSTAAFPYTHRAPVGIMALDMDPVSVFKKYAKSNIKFQEVSPIMHEISSLLESGIPTDAGTVNPRFAKPNLYEFLSKWSNQLAGMNPDFLPPSVRNPLQWLTKNTGISTLSGSVTSALLQPSAIANTVGQIGVYTAKGAALALDPREFTRAIRDSKVLKSRVAELDIDKPNMLRRTAEVGMLPLKWLDEATAVTTWLGAREFAKAKGMGIKDALRYADDVVVRTQSSTMANDIAPIQRTVAGRALAQFQTFMINNWNHLLTDLNPFGAKGSVYKTGRFVATAMVLNAIYKQFNMRPPFPDMIGAVENGDNAAEIAYNIASEAAEVVPFIGNIKFAKSPLQPPVIEAFNKLILGTPYKSSRQEIMDMVEDGEIPSNIIEQALKLGGVPGVNAVMKYVRAKKRGEEGWDALVGHYEK